MDAAHPPAPLEFGRFRVVRHRRELLVDGRAVELGGRAFDTLIALIDARGSIVDKDRLMRRVWPDRVVEENNLQAQISALRKVFGADRDLIRTVAGRGYQFTGDIRDAETAVTSPAGLTNLPSHLPDLIGRDASLGTVVDLITAHRLVTLTGAGGVGKTRLALEAARRLLPRFPDGVWLVELGPLADPALVPVTVATAVGLPLGTGPVTADRVAGALREKHLLLVLDNCEHMIDAAASMAAALVSAGALARVLATTLEPLRAPEEHIYRVPSLDVPAEDNLDADDVSRYGAIRLFDVRARAVEPGYVADRRRAATVAAICRRLDGIPLAIELAAARVPAFGVDGIAARLGDRFHLLTGGRRTALPRQQTLRATLDWSYELLSEPERITLRRLAVFAGGFSLEAATAVGSSPDLPASEVSDWVAGLVSRSLVSAHAGELPMQYRLLETTRAYAREKLSASGELATLARRHAEYFGALFEQGNTELGTRPVTEWMAAYGKQIDDVRAALDWAFSSSRDVAAGVALTIAVVPLWTHLSLMEECRRRVEQALGCLGPAASRDRRREMQLLAALGAALMYTKGAVPETRSAFAGTLEIADRLDDTDYRLRALWGLWVDRMNSGDVRQAMTLAETFSRAAAKSTDPLAAPVGDRMTGFALHFLGDQTQARRHIERMLDGPRPSVHELHIVRFQFDPWVTARSRLATILWLQGHPDQAVSTAQRGVEEAVALNHAVTLCNAFAQGACSVAFLAGDLAAAERFVTVLLEYSERHGLAFWHADGRCFKGVLLLRRGDTGRGLDMLRATLGELSKTPLHTRYDPFLGEVADALSRVGLVAEGLAAIDQALDRTKQSGGLWYVAELLRIKGEIVLRAGAPNAAAAAEELFRQSIDWAQRQDALSWELRASTSLARLWHGRRRGSQARTLLSAVYRRFTEGFGTADLVSAKALLDRLRP